MVKNICLGFTCLLSFMTYSQVDMAKVESNLAYHADVMINAMEVQHRVKACSAFQKDFEAMLATPGSYDYSFDAIKWISRMQSDDQSYKIYTWVVEDEEGISTPYGYVQFEDGTYIQLRDQSNFTADTEYELNDDQSWYGAVYYKVMPLESGMGKTDMLLFGYRQISKFDKIKILDVISVDDSKQITFGKEIFVKEIEDSRDEVRTRLLLTYSSDASVSLNYNESMAMIVHDHLIARMGRLPGQGPTNLPDGSYVGYKQDGDRYLYVDKLFDQVSETAPRPQPVLGQKDKNIFGKPKTQTKKRRNE